jgi:DNA uptake protein ComE-like DNA-binding protein
MIECKSCGRKLNIRANFCKYCGKKISEYSKTIYGAGRVRLFKYKLEARENLSVSPNIPEKDLASVQIMIGRKMKPHEVALGLYVSLNRRKFIMLTNLGIYWNTQTEILNRLMYNNIEVPAIYFEKSHSIVIGEEEKIFCDILNPSTAKEICIFINGATGQDTLDEAVVKWHLNVSGKIYGPFDYSTVQIMAKTGQINPSETRVKKESDIKWSDFSVLGLTVADREKNVFKKENTEKVEKYVDGLIDLNKANYDELIKIDGFDSVKAERIIKLRKSSGNFSSVNEALIKAEFKPHEIAAVKKLVKVDYISDNYNNGDVKKAVIKTASKRVVDY